MFGEAQSSYISPFSFNPEAGIVLGLFFIFVDFYSRCSYKIAGTKNVYKIVVQDHCSKS